MSLGTKMFRISAVALALGTGLALVPNAAFAQVPTQFVFASNDNQPDDDGDSWLDNAKDAVENWGNDSKCVDAELSFKLLDPSTMSVTTTGEKRDDEGDPICKGINFLGVKYLYTGIEAAYPQAFAEASELLEIRTLGTFTVTVPNWTGDDCAQGSFYAEWEGDEGLDRNNLPATLETEKSSHPLFVHDLLKGKGPSPTWVQAPTKGCNVPDPVSGAATLETKTCDANSRNWITATAVPGGIPTITDKNGHTKDLAAVGEGYSGGLPEGFKADVEYTISYRDVDSKDRFAVTPWSAVWTPVDTIDCNLYDASIVVTLVDATCDEKGIPDFDFANASWESKPDLSVGKHTAPLIADTGHLFPVEPSKENGQVKGVPKLLVKYTVTPQLTSEEDECAEAATVLPGAGNGEGTTASSGDSEPLPAGDSDPLAPLWAAFWIVVGIVVIAGIILLIFVVHRRRNAPDEDEPHLALDSPPIRIPAEDLTKTKVLPWVSTPQGVQSHDQNLIPTEILVLDVDNKGVHRITAVQ